MPLGLGLGLNNGSAVPAMAGGGAAALLPMSARIVFGENSYGAQGGNISYVDWAWILSGCKGMPYVGMNQSRNGDQIIHLHDRAGPFTATRAGVYIVMNPENELLSEPTVTNTNAGGDICLARVAQVIADVQAVNSDAVIFLGNQPNTNEAKVGGSRPIAAARYNTLLPIAGKVKLFDQASAFDPQNALDNSGDGIHPNKRKSAKALGATLGPLIAAEFVAGSVLDSALPTNLVPWNPATAWVITLGTSGLNCAQSLGTSSRSAGARVFDIDGTCAGDETLGTTGPDVTLKTTLNYTTSRDMWGNSLASLFQLEITDFAGGPPQGIATINFANGAATTFNKIYSATLADYWTEQWDGPMGIRAGQFSGTTNPNQVIFSIVVRGKNGAVVQVRVKISEVHHFATEDVAYGPATNMSAAFTSGRPIMFAIPSTSPAGAVALGATVNISASGFIVGGGITNAIDAIRNGTTDVGNATEVKNGQAAIPYTVAAPFVTSDTLTMRRTGSNTFNSVPYSASVDAAAQTIT